jgi:Fe-S-cluster containining protein
MFRIYELPRTFAAGPGWRTGPDAFYESKRLLGAFAARRTLVKLRVGGKTVEHVRYLTISALSLDGGTGSCTALSGGRCGVYERRPLACRTVPFHYSRPVASAEEDLQAFLATPGYRCDSTAAAPVILEGGRIADAELRRTRERALAVAGENRRWQEAIVRAIRRGGAGAGLPGLHEIEANAAFGATTGSMRAAWQIACQAGLIGAGDYEAAVAAQAALIDRQLAGSCGTPDTQRTLADMRAEYRQELEGGAARRPLPPNPSPIIEQPDRSRTGATGDAR